MAVIAKLVELPADAKTAVPLGSGAIGGDAKAKFEILDVLKGEKALASQAQVRRRCTLAKNPIGRTFLVMGVELAGD